MEDEDGISVAWERFVKDYLKKILPLEVEFGDIVFEGGTFEHCLFMKKNKLAHRTILLNVIDSCCIM